MKHLKLIICVVFLNMWSVHVAEESDSTPLPEQSTCKDVTAIPHSKKVTAMKMKLTIGRVLSSPAEIPDTTILSNNCSPFTYTPSTCQGSQVFLEIKDDGSRIVKTAAFNNVTNTLVCYVQRYNLIDENYQIYDGQVFKLGTVNDKGDYLNIDSVPEFVKNQQGKEIACVSIGPEGHYVIFIACDKSSGFVAYSQKAIDEKLIDSKLEAKINVLVKKYGFSSELFMDVPYEIPIDVNKCFDVEY